MKILLFTTLVAGLVAAPLMAQDTTKQSGAQGNAVAASKDSTSGTTQKESQSAKRAFLGVGVSEVHPAFGSYLREHLSSEQGLIVEDVAEGSAAQKAGIQDNDILIKYDDQKLFTPDQLAQLVQSDRPGKDVAIDLLREGKRQTVRVQLGERPNDEQSWNGDRSGRGADQGHNMRHFSHSPNSTKSDSAWEDFDSLSLKKLKDNKFRAEVQYLDKDNKTRHHVFEGTREEIRKDIQGQKDLKPEERMQLLRSLGLVEQNRFPFGPFQPGVGWFLDPDDQFD